MFKGFVREGAAPWHKNNSMWRRYDRQLPMLNSSSMRSAAFLHASSNCKMILFTELNNIAIIPPLFRLRTMIWLPGSRRMPLALQRMPHRLSIHNPLLKRVFSPVALHRAIRPSSHSWAFKRLPFRRLPLHPRLRVLAISLLTSRLRILRLLTPHLLSPRRLSISLRNSTVLLIKILINPDCPP